MAFDKRAISSLLITSAVVLCACTADVASRPTSSSRSLLSGVTSLLTSIDTTVTVITVDPAVAGTYDIGRSNKLRVEAGGICDLASTYGVGEWTVPCLPATLPVVITARTWADQSGHPHVDFFPRLRFVPLSGLVPSAVLYLYDPAASRNATSKILYCDAGVCVDESLTNAALVTSRDAQSGFVYRPILHFSGYQVATFDGSPPADSTP